MEKYFNDNGTIKRFRVENDPEPWNPRTEDEGNVGHMICWNRNYDLGDEHEYESPDHLLDEIINENYTDLSIYSYIKKNKTSNSLEIIYDRKEKEYQLIGDYRVWWNGNKVHHGVIASRPSKEWLVDDILDALPIPDKIHMLEKKGYFFMPVSIYDHSGITMYVGNANEHFDGQWDCSNVGWIYVQKDELIKSGCSYRGNNNRYYAITENNWKKAAEIILTSEVEAYDQYLIGECYGWIVEEFDEDNLDWIVEHSCWGYYSDKFGDELVNELASEIIENVDLYDTVNEARAAA